MVDANAPRWYRELCEWTPQHATCRWNRSPLGRSVVNQGENGWCWPIVVSELIATTRHLYLSRKQNNPEYTPLSIQELMDGVLFWNLHTYSFPLIDAFKWVKHFRLRTSNQYPWVHYKQEFRPKSDEEYIQAKNTTEFEIIQVEDENEDRIKRYLDNIGPLACEVLVSDKFVNLKEEIYEGSERYYLEGQRHRSHALILWTHGYDEERGQKYYVVKNSWGFNWGYAGFGRIACSSSRCFEGMKIDREGKDSRRTLGLAPYLIFRILHLDWDVQGAPLNAPHGQNSPPPNISNMPSCGFFMKRGGSAGDAGGGVERGLNQFVSKMDGMSSTSTVSVIEANNRPDIIDSTLLRPGRLNQLIYIPLPDEVSHLQIFKPCLRKSHVSKNVDIRALSEHTQRFKYAITENSDLPTMSIEVAPECNGEKNVIDLEDESIDAEILNFMATLNEHFATPLGTSNHSAVRETVVGRPNVSWEDIGGNVKRELQEFGMSPSKRVLFFGPHGCGKTVLAKAIANEFQANFISVKGPELLTLWFGESEANVRDIFDKACQSAPCVLFFDELDSLATHRGGSVGDAGDAANRVLNQLLTEMDGVSAKKTVFPIRATNRPDIIDSALPRLGHLYQLIYIPLPDEESPFRIFKPCLRKSRVSTNVDITAIAKYTRGFKYAITENIDLPAMSTEDALQCIRKNNVIDLEDESIDAEILNFMTLSNDHFATALGTSNPSVVRETVPNVSWEDIGSLGNAKGELQETVQYPVEHPEKFGMSPEKIDERNVFIAMGNETIRF